MKRLFVLLLTTVIIATSLIPVSAMDVDPLAYSKVNIADHLIGKEYVDNDVRLTYSVPVAPYTEIGGVMRDGIVEQLDQTTYVDFHNGKMTVPYGEELLHSWDFTQSLTDSVSGLEPTFVGAGKASIKRDDNGLTFGASNCGALFYLDEEKSEYSLLNKTVDVQFGNISYSSSSDYAMILRFVTHIWSTGAASGAGFSYSFDENAWVFESTGGGLAEPYLTEYDPTFFSNKTLRFVFDQLGYCYLFWANNGTEDFEFITVFNKRYFRPGVSDDLCVLGLGEVTDGYNNFFNGYIECLRIYDNTSSIDLNKYVKMNFDMLIMGTHYFEDVRVIDIADLRAGSEFDISFMLENALTINGSLQVPDGTAFEIQYLDKDFQKLSLLSISLEVHEAQLVDGNTWSYTFDGRVPRGAQYMYLQLTCHGMQVEGAESFTWMITALNMSFNISALEEQSKTQQQILNKLDDVADMLTPTPEQSDKADQMEDAIGDAADKLENNNSSLGQLTPTRPQINTDLQLDPDKLIAVSPLVTNIWSISGLQSLIGIVVLVATVAYIFFGKRDG